MIRHLLSSGGVNNQRVNTVYHCPCSKMKCDTLEGNFKGEVRIPI